ncbi:hypothetical protein PPACK8108_LOCUS20949 [Phakopsora pachyrhizi]|uniref:K Homology domain-containing protein n=1 Tax=Phakopsora pachyrhizi TaxID=170000 RepID=A0AAV0BIF4_PHAPC|nr:hypothetical protein PPACK8108_LOCUS20949 [Phakopsora pachyrhizi]
MAREQCFASATHSKGDSAYGFRLSGSFPQVMAARGRLLREQPFEVEKIVAVQRSDVLQGGINVPPAMKAQLDEIASSTRAHLSIVGSGDGSEGEVDIVIRGDQESAEEARIRLLILLDQLNGLHLEVCEIDYKLHYIIAGRKRSVIQSIQEETATNIYFPSLLSCGGILGTRYPNLLSKHNMIVITGEFFDAQRAREMLFQVSVHKSKCIISRDTTMHPRKLDWMLMEKLPTLQKIMNDNGTFINFPPIGSQVSAVSVYGDHRVQIERTIRTLMQLACEFYTADVWLLPGPFQSVYHNGPQSRLLINSNEIAADGHRISTESGAEIVFKSTNSFEVYGTDRSVKKAIEKILELDLVCKSQVEVRFQVELACEHRDFISGKKNGKLNKIMKTSNVKIKFEPFNDYNFLIDVSGDSARAMAGLKLLEEELPAEISFHIPEGYHKRIIGVGGKNIQRIMKKYGVYVKFTNAEEFASLGGYLDNHDNVVARTPAKNSSNLQNLKDSVMELVHPNDKDFVIESMVIDRQNHRSILAEKSIFIHDIELKTNTCFYFPSSESGLDKVAIFGPRSKISIARQMLVAQLGLEADYKLCCSAELLRLVRGEEFEEKVTSRIKRSWGVTLSVLSNIGDRDDLTFRFTLSRSAPENLKQAQETLEAYLIEKKFNFQPETGSARSFQRRSTVTSIGSADRSTSAGAFTPITPTDPLGFGYNIHYSGEKETDKVFGRPSTASKHTPSQGLLSNSTSSASSLLFHPNLFTRGQSIPAAGLQGSYSNGFGPGTRNGSLSDWKSSPRQISVKYSAATQGLRGGISASNLQNSIGAPGESVSRRFVASPRAQSIDLGKPSIGGNMMMSLFGSGGAGSLLGSSSLARGTLAIQAGGLHRHRFSQGTISSLAYEQNLINGLGGLKH